MALGICHGVDHVTGSIEWNPRTSFISSVSCGRILRFSSILCEDGHWRISLGLHMPLSARTEISELHKLSASSLVPETNLRGFRVSDGLVDVF